MFGYNEDRQFAAESRDARSHDRQLEQEKENRFAPAPLPKKDRFREILDHARMQCKGHKDEVPGYLAQWIVNLELELKRKSL